MQCTSFVVRLALLGALLGTAAAGTVQTDIEYVIHLLRLAGDETIKFVSDGDCNAAAYNVEMLNYLWRHQNMSGMHEGVGRPLSAKLGSSHSKITRELSRRPMFKPCTTELWAMGSFIRSLLTTPN